MRGTTRRSRTLRAAAAGLAALGLLAAAGCGDSGDSGSGKVTIRYSWWGDANRAKMINKQVALFEKKYPNIDVKTDFSEYDDFWKKFATQAAGGGAPDVFQNAPAYLREYVDKGVVLDLDSQVKAGNLKMDDFRLGLEKFGQLDGKLYGVSVGDNTFAVIYNTDAFKKVGVTPKKGWTWDEFNSAVKKISDLGGVKGYSGNGGVMYLYDIVLRQQNKAFYTEDGKLGFTKADLKSWWKDNVDKTEQGVYADPKKVEQALPQSAISSDLSAAEFTWDNFIARYVGETDAPLAVAPLPTLDGKHTGQYLSGMELSGYARTKHPKEVAQFINFMVHDPAAGKTIGYNRGVLPTNAQYKAFQPTGADALVAKYEEQLGDVVEQITPHPAGTGVVEAAFLRIYQDLSHGGMSVDEAVDQFFDEANDTLSSS